MRGSREGALRISGDPLTPRANIYIDGFNLYFGALQGTPYKWLNPRLLATGLLKRDTKIGRIRYFTARVSNRAARPGSPARQDAYLQALGTLSEVEVEYGLFRERPAYLPLADGSGMARVLRTEEKGSDVNLATHLLFDAFARDCDVALVISNDSDLILPVRKVRELGLVVGVAAPVYNGGRHPQQALVAEAHFTAHIARNRTKLLRESQFPPVIRDAAGAEIIRKPPEWE